MKIRPLEASDLEQVHRLWSDPGVIPGTTGYPTQPMDQVKRRLFDGRDGNRHDLVSVIDDVVVGIVGLRVLENPRLRHCGSLYIMVADEYQGRGVGTALMKGILEAADDWLGLHRIQLEVNFDNVAARRLYEKFGFVVEGTLRQNLLRRGTYIDSIVMGRLRPRPL